MLSKCISFGPQDLNLKYGIKQMFSSSFRKHANSTRDCIVQCTMHTLTVTRTLLQDARRGLLSTEEWCPLGDAKSGRYRLSISYNQVAIWAGEVPIMQQEYFEKANLSFSYLLTVRQKTTGNTPAKCFSTECGRRNKRAAHCSVDLKFRRQTKKSKL